MSNYAFLTTSSPSLSTKRTLSPILILKRSLTGDGMVVCPLVETLAIPRIFSTILLYLIYSNVGISLNILLYILPT